MAKVTTEQSSLQWMMKFEAMNCLFLRMKGKFSFSEGFQYFPCTILFDKLSVAVQQLLVHPTATDREQSLPSRHLDTSSGSKDEFLSSCITS